MTKLNFLAFTLLIIIALSCSSNDDSNTENPNQNQKQLVRIESTEFFGNSNVSETIKRYFENGKLIVDSTWNANGEFRSKRNYTYNSAGVISREEFVVIQTGLTAIWNYSYDDQGRLINYDFEETEPGFGTFESRIEYNYVSSTLVEATNLNNGTVTDLNFTADGLLLSSSSYDATQFAQYTYLNNGAIETITYPVENELVTISYSDVDVLGGFSRLETFFNGNIKNFLLNAGEIPYAGESYFGAEKLIISRVYEDNGFISSVTYQHLLDSDGYLINETQTSIDYDGDYYSSAFIYSE